MYCIVFYLHLSIEEGASSVILCDIYVNVDKSIHSDGISSPRRLSSLLCKEASGHEYLSDEVRLKMLAKLPNKDVSLFLSGVTQQGKGYRQFFICFLALWRRRM